MDVEPAPTSAATDGPGAFGPPLFDALIRHTPDDFRVEEVDAFPASGEGEHLLLRIEKRGLNTAEVARRLAAWAGVAEVAIGYAGMKDRHALTVQRFSVHLPRRTAPDPAGLDAPDLRVLDRAWHNRKLQRGALAGNRFALVLRGVECDRSALAERLAAIAVQGMPNFFGEQRFGRGGGNPAAALSMFAGRRVKRSERAILLSAARSVLFNAVLAARVAAGNWASGLEGEVWMLDGSRSVFGPEPLDATLAERARQLDIHPTGPLWGRGRSMASGPALAIEQAALAPHAALAAGLEAAGLNQERRALRVRVDALECQWLAADRLHLSFTLGAGCYATALLACLGRVGQAIGDRPDRPDATGVDSDVAGAA